MKTLFWYYEQIINLLSFKFKSYFWDLPFLSYCVYRQTVHRLWGLLKVKKKIKIPIRIIKIQIHQKVHYWRCYFNSSIIYDIGKRKKQSSRFVWFCDIFTSLYLFKWNENDLLDFLERTLYKFEGAPFLHSFNRIRNVEKYWSAQGNSRRRRGSQ